MARGEGLYKIIKKNVTVGLLPGLSVTPKCQELLDMDGFSLALTLYTGNNRCLRQVPL